MKTFCLALALTVIMAALLADVTAGFEGQVPVLPPGVAAPPPGGVGHSCNAYAKCKKGMCCLRSQLRSPFGVSNTCKPLGKRGEECSESSTKGDIYHGHCPCSSGLRCQYVKPNKHICVNGE
uniref:Putative avitoxin-var2 n=1 Tax=Ixodes ricinus TaxID=34613 RepID=V5H4B8_IXORI